MACHEKESQDFFFSFFIEERLTKMCICLKAPLETFSTELFFQKQANSLHQECQHGHGAGGDGGHSSKVRCIRFGETCFLRQSLNMIFLLLREHVRNGFSLLPSLAQKSPR